MKNNILAFDTSMGPCSVAVLKEGELVSNQLLMDTHQQVKMLMPMVENAMQEAGLAYRDLDAIAVGIGPGSFTGIRIGMAAAHGFALAGNIPLIGITTLEAMAFATSHTGTVGTIMHAGKGQFYCQWFTGASPHPDGEASLLTREEVLASYKPSTCVLAGNAAAEFAPSFSGAIVSDVIFPQARYIAQLAASGQQESAHHLEPLYIRPPDAKPSAR